MIIKERLIIRPCCTLSLPLAEAENKSEAPSAALMNDFYEKMAREIISYTECRESCVRRYRSTFEAVASGTEIRIKIRLTVRKTDKLSGSVVLKRSVFNLWRGGSLAVFRTSED